MKAFLHRWLIPLTFLMALTFATAAVAAQDSPIRRRLRNRRPKDMPRRKSSRAAETPTAV